MRSRFSYARMLVEVDVTKELVREFDFRLPNGKHVHQTVVYEHEPILCAKCRRIGHDETNCKVKEKRRGRSKSRPRKDDGNSVNAQPIQRENVVKGRSRSRGGPSARPVGETEGTEKMPMVQAALPGAEPTVYCQGEKTMGRAGLPGAEPTVHCQGEKPMVRAAMPGAETTVRAAPAVAGNITVADKGKEKADDEEFSSVGNASQWSKLWQPIDHGANDVEEGSFSSFCKGMASEDELENLEKQGTASAKKKAKKKKKQGKKGEGPRPHH